MKEFTSQTGGRYTYIDDILNLQELALAITSIFDGCDNFIISGCEVSGSAISSGYVFINGKIRYCAGASNLDSYPVYICENNSVDKVSYADSGDKVGRNIYGCVVASKLPANVDILTGVIPQFIKIEADGSGMRMKDAFFGKYALVIDSAYGSQSVKKNVALGGDLAVAGDMNAKGDVNILRDTVRATIAYVGNSLVIQSTVTGKPTYKLVISPDGDFQFYNGDSLLCTLNNNGITASVPINATTINVGNIRIAANQIYDIATSSDNGLLEINMLGYNGGSLYYRDTVIGDGKRGKLLELNGKTRISKFHTSLQVLSSEGNALQLIHGSLSKTDKALQSYLHWLDKNNATMATIGYLETDDYDWYINNAIGNVIIDNDTYITGKLYVGGVDIMSSLVSKTDMNNSLSSKADSSDVYTKQITDDTFVKRIDGISAFVTEAGGGETGKESVRNAIGAVSQAELNEAVMKSQLFKDIVANGLPSASDSSYASSLIARKRALCENIGAAYKDDVQASPKDTGWLTMSVQNCGITTKLYVRQVGHVVSIQGELHTHHSGTIFTLPNSIDPPKYKIGYSHNKDGIWHCIINGGSRDCVVDKCDNGCSEYIGFLITYLV